MKALRITWRAFQLGWVVSLMVLSWFYSKLGIRKLWWSVAHRGQPYEPLTNPALVRTAFERLGPTFIKLGQLIASSPGLFPAVYSREFQKCLDRVPPFRPDELKAIVEAELGAPVEQLFASFEPQPLAAASVAQVHGAILHDGSDVVIKVQRPAIRQVVDADLWWMTKWAWLLDKLFMWARLANLRGVMADFDTTIHEELDFRMEGANLTEFNAMMAEHGIDDVKAPVPVPDMATERVLVMERFRGFKADDVEGVTAAGIDPEEYLRKGLRAWLITVMLHGFFHGDAHAGNLMLLPQGPAVGFLDFGIIGRFTTEQRHHVMRYVLAFGAQDYAALGDVLVEIGAVDGAEIEREPFIADLHKTYSPLMEKRLSDIKYEELMPDITRIAYKYGIILPREFLLILKQLLYFDRYAKLAAPDLNVFNDYYLVDFLFTPDAHKAGIDFNQLMPLMKQIQQRRADAVAAEEQAAAE